MNLLIWLALGGIIGWLASILMKTDAQQGIIMNIVVGVVGAFLGGWLLAPRFAVATINQNDFSMPSLVISFLGAVVLLVVVNLFNRGRAR